MYLILGIFRNKQTQHIYNVSQLLNCDHPTIRFLGLANQWYLGLITMDSTRGKEKYTSLK